MPVTRDKDRVPGSALEARPRLNAAMNPVMSARDRRRQRRLRWLGAAILVVGLTAAGIAYRRAQSDDWAAALVRAGTLASGNAKRAENQLKELGGKANVLAADFQDWFASLWHRRRLAGTLVVLSLGGAGACFFLAHLLNYPPASDHHADPPT